MGKIRSFFSNFDSMSLALILGVVIVIGSLGTSIFYVSNLVNIDNQPQNWVESRSILSNYNDMKTTFNSQKQAIIDAYNSQVNEIRVNGLKTETDFDGLRFKSDIFKNKVNEIKDSYSKNDPKNAKILALWTSLNDRVNAKMTKIKAFYDARVRNIYSTLKNEQKVKFASLTEYNIGKSAQFSNKDFDAVGSEMNRENDAPVYLTSAIAGFALAALFAFLVVAMIRVAML